MGVSPKLIVEVVADVSQFVKSMSTSTKAATAFQADLKAVSVDARAAANAQVAAAVKTTDALHAEVAAYSEIAAAAAAGSKEQIAAARLGATAQHRLDASLVGAAGSARKTHGESQKLGRDLEHVTRGAISGTGALHGFGRSLAFASGGFVAFEGVSRFLTDSINAAREAGVAQRSLAAQMKASGESFDLNRERIEKVALSYGKFGFQNDAVIASLTVLERGTGSINKAIAVQGLTADIARAKNLDLAAAATIVAKVFGGQETALRRAVPGLEKNAHGWDLIRQAQQKMAGQAAANTTAAEQFAATLHNTEEIIGLALLPTLNKYLTQLSKWLDRMDKSGKLQEDVAQGAKIVGGAFDIATTAIGKTIAAYNKLPDFGKHQGLLDILRPVKGPSGLDLLHSLGIGDSKKVDAATGSVARLTEGLKKAGSAGKQVDLRTAGGIQIDKLLPGPTAAQRNTWFDAIIGRQISRVSALPLEQQLAAWNKISAAITRRIAITKDITRKLNLEDQLFAAEQSKKAVREQQQQAFFDRLQLNVDMASLTKTTNDDLAALRVQQAGIEKQIRIQGHTLELDQAWLANQQAIAAKNEERAAATKASAAAAKAAKQAANDEQLAWAQYGIAKAETTKTLQDDLKAARHKLAVVTAQAATGKRTAEKAQAVLDAQTAYNAKVQEIADAAKARRLQRQETRQYQALGLGPGGADLIPTAANLRKRLGPLANAIDGTFLDTKANNRLLGQIRRVLTGGLGKVDADVRARIAQMFAGWRQQLNNETKKTRPTGRRNPYGQAGYWVDDMFFATNVGSGGGGVPAVTPATTEPARPFSGAGAGVNITNLNLYGVQDVPTLENELVKRAATRPQPRRGP